MENHIVGYAVYSPPQSGLPYLAVTFLPDGKVEARQFDNAKDAEDFSNASADGKTPSNRRH